MVTHDVLHRMREEWNRRAQEDARYYIACGARGQSDEDFASGAEEVVERIRRDLVWLPPDRPLRARRLLEIGCGIGRIMRPLSALCGEIHGVDISDAMVRQGREWLADTRHAHLHHTPDSDLSAFADAGFDLVYSFAVMQHLPEAALFWRYFAEAVRVLRMGGVLVLHVNTTPDGRTTFDSWAGITVREAEMVAAAQAAGLRIRSLEGAGTQYTWLTAQRVQGERPCAPRQRFALQRVERADGKATVLVAGGPQGHAAIFVHDMGAEYAELPGLAGVIAGRPAPASFVGAPSERGVRQVNVAIPSDLPPGLHAVGLTWQGERLTDTLEVETVRHVSQPPRLDRISDGLELSVLTEVRCGWAKAWILNLASPDALRVTVGGVAVEELQLHCENAEEQRFQVNLRIPETVPAGTQAFVFRIAEGVLASRHMIVVRR